jgi:uncharacterized UBP type Zn finger protein
MKFLTKKKTIKGITNVANNCYGNSTIQLLRHAQGFVDAIIACQLDNENNIMYHLKQCFLYFQQNSQLSKESNPFLEIIRAASVGHPRDSNDIANHHQNDPITFAFNLLDYLRSISLVLADEFFYFETMETLTCSQPLCKHSRSNTITHGLLQLSMFRKHRSSQIENEDDLVCIQS